MIKKYRVAKLKDNKGYIGAYFGSPIIGTYSRDPDKIRDWIAKNRKLQRTQKIEKEAYDKLKRLPTNTDMSSIEEIL